MRETFSVEDGKLIHRKDFLVDEDRGKILREHGKSALPDSWHVGTIPMPILTQWFREAGVSWSDTTACQEVIRRKLLSGDFQKFRVKEGHF